MESNTSSVNQPRRQQNMDFTKLPYKRAETMNREELCDLRTDLENLISGCKNKSLSDSDLNRMKNDFVNKIASTRGETKNMFAHPRAQLDNSLNRAKDYMQNYPGRSVGYSALVGVLMGLMINRPGFSKSTGSVAAHALRPHDRPSSGPYAAIMRHLEQAFRPSDPDTCRKEGGGWCWCPAGVNGAGQEYDAYCCNTDEEPLCKCEDPI